MLIRPNKTDFSMPRLRILNPGVAGRREDIAGLVEAAIRAWGPKAALALASVGAAYFGQWLKGEKKDMKKAVDEAIFNEPVVLDSIVHHKAKTISRFGPSKKKQKKRVGKKKKRKRRKGK